jgi:hypothetical protein
MGKLRVAKISSDANAPTGVGVTKNVSPGQRKPMLVYGYTCSPRGAGFASDVQVYLFQQYSESRELVGSAAMTPVLTNAYSSNFTASADSWVDLGGGNPTITFNQTIGGVTGCLKILSVGGDACSFKRPTTCTSGKVYKMVFDHYLDAGHGVVAFGLGDNGDAWDLGFDHDAGKHPAIGAGGAWVTDATLFGTADATDLELCGFTAINNQVRDVLVDGKALYLKNIVLSEVTNNGHWTRSADTDVYWDMYNEVIDADASGAATATENTAAGKIDSGGIFKSTAVVSSYVAGDLWLSAGGVTMGDMDADGTYTRHLVSTATTGLVINADATGDGDITDVSLKQEMKTGNTGLTLSDSVYNASIRSGQGWAEIIEFPKPFMTSDGWFMYFTAGGASCILDINVFYEYM